MGKIHTLGEFGSHSLVVEYAETEEFSGDEERQEERGVVTIIWDPYGKVARRVKFSRNIEIAVGRDSRNKDSVKVLRLSAENDRKTSGPERALIDLTGSFCINNESLLINCHESLLINAADEKNPTSRSIKIFDAGHQPQQCCTVT